MENNWITEIGKPAYEAVEEMVDALNADRERLEELRDEQASYEGDATWEDDNPDDAEELSDLTDAVTLDGQEVDEDEARDRIMEDPLSLRVFGERVDGEWEANSYELLLTTGGPAVRIVGDICDGEAASARLEVQDWGKPWSVYFVADTDILMAYASCFCFGE